MEEAQTLLESIVGLPGHTATDAEPIIIKTLSDPSLRPLSLSSFGVTEDCLKASFCLSSDVVELDLDVCNGSLRIEPSDNYFHLEVIKKIIAGAGAGRRTDFGYKFAE